MSFCRKPRRGPTLWDLGKRTKDKYGWAWKYASKEEQEYVKSLNSKDLLDYLKQIEQENFLDNI